MDAVRTRYAVETFKCIVLLVPKDSPNPKVLLCPLGNVYDGLQETMHTFKIWEKQFDREQEGIVIITSTAEPILHLSAFSLLRNHHHHGHIHLLSPVLVVVVKAEELGICKANPKRARVKVSMTLAPLALHLC